MAGVTPPASIFQLRFSSPTVVIPGPTPLRGWLASLHFSVAGYPGGRTLLCIRYPGTKNKGGGGGGGGCTSAQSIPHEITRNTRYASKNVVVQFQRGLKKCPIDVSPHRTRFPVQPHAGASLASGTAADAFYGNVGVAPGTF